jgi:hypothetical protein
MLNTQLRGEAAKQSEDYVSRCLLQASKAVDRSQLLSLMIEAGVEQVRVTMFGSQAPFAQAMQRLHCMIGAEACLPGASSRERAIELDVARVQLPTSAALAALGNLRAPAFVALELLSPDSSTVAPFCRNAKSYVKGELQVATFPLFGSVTGSELGAGGVTYKLVRVMTASWARRCAALMRLAAHCVQPACRHRTRLGIGPLASGFRKLRRTAISGTLLSAMAACAALQTSETSQSSQAPVFACCA